MLRQFPFHPPQYIGSLAASSHVSSLAPTWIPLYKPTPLDYLNYPLRYEALFLFLSWHMQRVNKTPSNPLWNCHQFTLSFIKLQNFVFEWRPQLVYHFQNVSRNSVGKVNGNSEIRVPLFQIFCWIKFQAFAAIIRIHLMGLLQLVNVILKQDLPASSSLPNPLQCPCSRFPLANVKWKGEHFTLLLPRPTCLPRHLSSIAFFQFLKPKPSIHLKHVDVVLR